MSIDEKKEALLLAKQRYEENMKAYKLAFEDDPFSNICQKQNTDVFKKETFDILKK